MVIINYNMFRHRSAILREYIQTKELYILTYVQQDGTLHRLF